MASNNLDLILAKLLKNIESEDYNLEKKPDDILDKNDIETNLILYTYIKYLEQNDYVLNAYQNEAIDIIDNFYKSNPSKNIFKSEYFTKFKKIYDAAKKFKEENSDDIDDKIKKQIKNLVSKLYIEYNQDITKEFANSQEMSNHVFIDYIINDIGGEEKLKKYDDSSKKEEKIKEIIASLPKYSKKGSKNEDFESIMKSIETIKKNKEKAKTAADAAATAAKEAADAAATAAKEADAEKAAAKAVAKKIYKNVNFNHLKRIIIYYKKTTDYAKAKTKLYAAETVATASKAAEAAAEKTAKAATTAATAAKAAAEAAATAAKAAAEAAATAAKEADAEKAAEAAEKAAEAAKAAAEAAEAAEAAKEAAEAAEAAKEAAKKAKEAAEAAVVAAKEAAKKAKEAAEAAKEAAKEAAAKTGADAAAEAAKEAAKKAAEAAAKKAAEKEAEAAKTGADAAAKEAAEAAAEAAKTAKEADAAAKKAEAAKTGADAAAKEAAAKAAEAAAEAAEAAKTAETIAEAAEAAVLKTEAAEASKAAAEAAKEAATTAKEEAVAAKKAAKTGAEAVAAAEAVLKPEETEEKILNYMLNDKNIYELLLIYQKIVDGNYTDLFNNKINDANKKVTKAETVAEAAKKKAETVAEAAKKKAETVAEAAKKAAEEKEAAKAAAAATTVIEKEKKAAKAAADAKNKKYIKSVNNYNDAVNDYLKAINKQNDAEDKHNDAKNIKTIITLITEYYNNILLKKKTSGGAIMDTKKPSIDIKKIIDNLKDNIAKLTKININIKDINKVEKNAYKMSEDIKYTPNNEIKKLKENQSDADKAFKEYKDNILKAEKDKKILKQYLDDIKIIHEEIFKNIRSLDIKDVLLKEKVKELLNDYQIKDLDITYNIQELEDITTTEYKANKEFYEKKIEQIYIADINSINKRNELGEANKLIEEIKKKGMRGSSFSGGEDQSKKTLKGLIDLLKSIKLILETGKNKSSNNSNSNLNKDPSQFEKIWNSYNKYLTDIKLEHNGKNGKTEMDANDYLYDQVEVNDLNPIIALQLTDNDKYVFCGLTYFIRLSIVIILDLLINYNILKKLEHALIIFIFMYVSILALITAVVNYDTYKLRILLNYFNMNMNTSKLLLHVFLVVIFYILILIIIFNNTDKTNDTNDVEFINVLDFTYIYNYIFDILDNNKTLKPKNINLTQKEKLKLLYRVEILTMIVYIFSSFIILMV